MKLVEGLFYTEEHDWIKVEGDIATIGITDKAQNLLGDIVYVELPEPEDEIKKDAPCGVIESVKAATDLIAPLSGEVVEVNEEAVESPETINEDAFSAWLFKIKLSRSAELDELMDMKAYEGFCKEEE